VNDVDMMSTKLNTLAIGDKSLNGNFNTLKVLDTSVATTSDISDINTALATKVSINNDGSVDVSGQLRANGGLALTGSLSFGGFNATGRLFYLQQVHV
jgi:hypothetical protein